MTQTDVSRTTQAVAAGVSPGGAAAIVARIERLPFSAWHLRTVGLVGLASFFDAFDALTIAFVLPVLVSLWKISPGEIGLLISIGYAGQLIGATFMSGLAERIGRVTALRLAVAILALLSIACAFAGSYTVLLVLRFIQGIGLGAEVPLAATYINEACPARFRGRLVFLLQVTFAAGVAMTSLIALWVIPRFGWEAMFYIGGLPLLLAIFYPRLVPESARWLANRGRIAEADAVVTRMESEISNNGRRPLPPVGFIGVDVPSLPSSLRDLFSAGYTARTVTIWVIMFCTSLTGYGLLTWLPTIYRTVYKLPVNETLQFSILGGMAGLLSALIGTSVIDIIGRRWTFFIAFAGSAVPLYILYALPLGAPVIEVVTLATISLFFITILLAGVYAYVPEIYPTRMRALGAGVASSWLRLASIIGPTIVGLLIANAGTSAVFLLFALSSTVGAIVVLLFMIETKGRLLEDIAG